MSYGHAERNLALIRQLEAETRQLFGSLAQSEPEQRDVRESSRGTSVDVRLPAAPR